VVTSEPGPRLRLAGAASGEGFVAASPTAVARPPVLEARGVSRNFRSVTALRDVSIAASAGEVHALLGPNGAGKTTLLRVLTGLVAPTGGSVTVLGREPGAVPRGTVGLVPSGDRSFYLRISGLENLVFFGRLSGLRRRSAVDRALVALEDVGLANAARRRVGTYSHGMQKRLSVARALMTDPPVLLVDEATHDLDPEGAERIRALIGGIADAGTAVVWATQRVDEIRGFADRVTFLADGRRRFTGSVDELIARAGCDRYVVRLRGAALGAPARARAVQSAVGARAHVALTRAGDTDHVVLTLQRERSLGEAIAALAEAGFDVVACRQERSEIEDAFLVLTEETAS
jgi:ABC-2 type transport system ATP-binding protein